jgi:hypothetical protein
LIPAIYFGARQCEIMKYIKGIGVALIAVIAPAAVAHALSSPDPNKPIGILMIGLLEVLGFTFLVAALRPRLLFAILTAFAYFPLLFILIFEIGVSAGYYDFP